MKRLFDLFVALAGITMLWPLMLISALLIRLETSGPALFRQQRVGLFGRPFICLKLRTMFSGTTDLPTHDAPPAAVTKFGRVARRFKIDEVPQLINVVKGEMSLVGPRPCLLSQMELIVARQQQGVFTVLPGITGLAQVQGIDMSDPVRLAAIDGEYVRTRTFSMDVRLIWVTVFGLRKGSDQIRHAGRRAE